MSQPLRLLCVHPHPDDESIACGGVLARAREQAVSAAVVTCTGGEAGENLAGIDLGDEDLATHRRRELGDALAALGVADHVWLGYRDSGMAGTPENGHPESFASADPEEAAHRLAGIIRDLRPHVVVSDDALGTYGHPDHVQAHRVTVRAVEVAADPDVSLDGRPAWRVAKRYVHTLAKERLLLAHTALLEAGLASPFGDGPVGDAEDLPFGVPREQVTTCVDVRPHLERKQAALRAHRSQIGEDSFFLNTPRDLAEAFFGYEEFVLEDGERVDDPATGRESDLFAGLAADGSAELPR
jgi:N-acetyl-1-D-myo-inositol-2-amino-2-deoxy-alpha-D-glucopyranoside deacetylase